VLGFREATIRLTDSAVAHGFAAAIPERLEVTVGNGRGERSGDDNNHVMRSPPVMDAGVGVGAHAHPIRSAPDLS
jgi:hypothetical protein